MNYDQLDQFGKEFIRRVRDASIEEYLAVKKGKLNSETSQNLHRYFKEFQSNEIKKIDAIALEVIETMLHKMLFMFEDNDIWAIVMKESAAKSKIEHLAAVSDGLSGELYSEDGWIQKYSAFKHDSLDPSK